MAHYFVTAGRCLIGFYFFFFTFWNSYHFKAALSVFKQRGIPYAAILLRMGICLEACTSLLIIFSKFTALSAGILVIFVIAATLIYHQFWTLEPGPERTLNCIIFIGNLTVTLGGLLLLVGFYAVP